jgi:hypothetical protein
MDRERRLELVGPNRPPIRLTRLASNTRFEDRDDSPVRLVPDSRHKLRNAGPIIATSRETLARLLPQPTKPKSLRRNTPEADVR